VQHLPVELAQPVRRRHVLRRLEEDGDVDAPDAARGVEGDEQALPLGLRDVGALAEVLIRARRRGEDPGAADVLARYQFWRRWDTVTLALAMDGFNRLFSNDNSLLRLARGVGLGIVNATPRLRRAFIREAAGLTGDLPALMRGQQI